MIKLVFLSSIFLLTFFIQPNNGMFESFMEGYYHTEGLPGSESDPRGIPNLPFVTDTNRYADGYTSSSYFDVSSPHFPIYGGALANVSERYKAYVEYMENAAEQGIAGYGAGDAAKEDARVKITSIPGYENTPAPTKTFTVYAAIKWNPSGFAIQEGEYYNITVGGSQVGYSSQFWYDGGIRVNAEGYASYFDAVSNCFVGLGRCRSHLKKLRRLPSANWMALACAIGEFVRPLFDIEKGKESQYRWMPLDESRLIETVFHVGRTVLFRAQYSGELICFANDAHTLYWNNIGQLQVTATRASWPPPTNIIYQHLYLPACDSALVTYDPKLQVPGVKCNPNGGGSGWTESNANNNISRYGSGAPDYILSDLHNFDG